VNENLFGYYHLFIGGQAIGGEGDRVMPAHDLQKALTDLAQVTLRSSLNIVADELGLDDMPMAVLGLGKMGSGHMAPQSDLDLVFIFADDMDTELSAKIVRRLRTTLMTPLREGIAYELDMRLRPSGRSGPPAVKLSSFVAHHNERAKTWEHIALCSAKTVAGDPGLCAKVDAAIETLITRPRNIEQCLSDAKLMWHRIADQRVSTVAPDIINAKLAEGGLMQAEYVRAIWQLIGQPSEALDEAIDFSRRLQIWERLFDLKGKTPAAIPSAYHTRFVHGNETVFLSDMSAHSHTVTQAMTAIFEGVAFDPDEREAAVIWR